ncbi:MAG: hypothetical protein ACLFT3_20515 [Cyclobacteriaceae bacterium]
MAEHLTHIAIYDDTYRLVLHSDDFHEAFQTSLRNHPDIGLLCSASRGNHLFAIPFLEEVRDQWNSRKPGDGVEEKIAAAIGWLSHRAIDLQVKPMYLKIDKIKEARYSETENEIYHDAVTFDKVYERGKATSVSPHVYLSEAILADHMQGHPAAGLLHVAQVEPMMCAMVQQNLLSLSQFNETAQSPDEWLDKFPDHYQKLGENLHTYIEAFQRPDPVKMEKYIHSVNYYNEEDELIQLARELQHKGKSSIQLDDAVAKAENQSHYAQGLRRSIHFIRSANAFFEKKMDKETVYDQVEIFHKPHRI